MQAELTMEAIPFLRNLAVPLTSCVELPVDSNLEQAASL